jgi:hypothetical protein
MKRICVFCGSSPGSRPEYGIAAEDMGRELVRRNIGLVYGGGNVGLMGVIADAVLRAGGEAQGVIPENLMAREVGHKGLTKLHVVRSMHERKALMADLSDVFVAMPGGMDRPRSAHTGRSLAPPSSLSTDTLFESFVAGSLALVSSKPLGDRARVKAHTCADAE